MSNKVNETKLRNLFIKNMKGTFTRKGAGAIYDYRSDCIEYPLSVLFNLKSRLDKIDFDTYDYDRLYYVSGDMEFLKVYHKIIDMFHDLKTLYTFVDNHAGFIDDKIMVACDFEEYSTLKELKNDYAPLFNDCKTREEVYTILEHRTTVVLFEKNCIVIVKF